MSYTVHDATAHLLQRLNEVVQHLEKDTSAVAAPDRRLGDVLDSMAMVEFLAILAEDYGVTTAAIEQCVGRRFGTIAEMAADVHRAGWIPGGKSTIPRAAAPSTAAAATVLPRTCWLAATTARLPDTIESAAAVNLRLQRPEGWLERHAGIQQRRVWAHEDPVNAATEAGLACVERADCGNDRVGALLVTSEAPPLLAGLAAVLHHRLRLASNVPAFEIGGACTGCLMAYRVAQALLPQVGAVLVIAVEAATRYLHVHPGPEGENAALFGDGAAASLLCTEPIMQTAVALGPVLLGVDGSSAGVLQVELSKAAVEFRMKRIELASRAVEAMARGVKEVVGRHGLRLPELAVVAHGGNGRLPRLLARKLGLPPERVWSETPRTANLGSASLPVAWASHEPGPKGPAIWTAVGAGLTWGAVLVGDDRDEKRKETLPALRPGNPRS